MLPRERGPSTTRPAVTFPRMRPHQAALRRLSPDEFRDVIGHFASGVTVVTALHDGRPFGTTASAVTSLSLEPPMVLICMNRESETGQAIAASGRFAINVLGEDQAEAAVRFARKGADKFDGVPVTPGEWGEPLLHEALATLECRVSEQTTGGTHHVFLAEVDRASARGGAPLAYYRGQFGRLELSRATGDNAEAGARRLTAEAISDNLGARAAIELGAAALTIGALTGDQLDACRRLPLPEFLERIVGLGGGALLAAYRRLAIPSIVLSRSIEAQGPGVAAAAERARTELADAYERADLEAASSVIRAHSERLIEVVARHIEATGGEI